MKSDQERSPATPKAESEAGSSSTAMKDLLDEAGKMLRSMDQSPSGSSASSVKEEGEDTRKEVLEKLHQQLKAMQVEIKVFRLNQLVQGKGQGLIDSGATHALRPARKEEKISGYEEVYVTLASGASERMKISPGGVMISPNPATEPIVPMGLLITKLNCKIKWEGPQLRLVHPKEGEIPVQCEGGCPQVTRSMALKLIQELEEQASGFHLKGVHCHKEFEWMKELIEVHPVLKELPRKVKEELAEIPGDWSRLPANKRHRRRWKKEGVILHLYAGEDQGFTFGKAWKQSGGDPGEVLEVDIKRGQHHDMMEMNGIYSNLLRVALEGKIRGLLGGPNCRTRSILRHRPIPGNPSAPRPIRRWGGEEFGIKDATNKERAILHEDDVLMWKFWFLLLVNDLSKKALGVEEETAVAMEQPASPKKYNDQVVSFWDTKEWKELQKKYDFDLVTYNQKDLGGLASKMTSFGTNLQMEVEQSRMKQSKEEEEVEDSKALARWSPGTMSMVAKGLLKFFGRKIKLKAMTMKEHLEFGHIPYRKDCAVCQQTLQQRHPHRRPKIPTPGVLSLDSVGPLRLAKDVEGNKKKFFLCGALCWAVPKGSSKMEQEDEPEEEEGEPPIEFEGEEEEKPEEGAPIRGRPRKEKKDPEAIAVEPDLLIQGAEEGQEEEEDDQGQKEEEGQEIEYRTFRLAIPMSSRSAHEVTATAMDMVLQLRTEGYHIGRIHTDRGHEFAKYFQTWARNRGIHLSRTAGDDPRQNGRCEVAVKNIKTQVRKVLRGAEAGPELWPMALRYVNALNRSIRRDETPKWPPFLSPVVVRKRRWNRDDFSPTMEVVKYVAPSVEDHGHWVIGEDDQVRLTRFVVRKVDEVPDAEEKWIALEKEEEDAFQVRRRMRNKRTIRKFEGKEDEGSEEKEKKERLSRLLEEEARTMPQDDIEGFPEQLKLVAKIKKILQDLQPEEEEVLQTKIVSLKEVSKEWHKWESAAKSEIDSLLHEKMAFKPVDKKELEALIREADAKGLKVEFLPSKLVCTKKPGKAGGRPKIRWVICGNFESKGQHENNFSSGADSTAFRVLLVFAVKKGWKAGTVDIKTAFLNALMEQDGESLIIVKAPYLLVEKGCIPQDVHYLPLRAVYGLRRSPRLWGECRDAALLQMEVEVIEDGRKIKLKFYQMESEPNMWKICETGEETSPPGMVRGVIMTYVDDLFVTGEDQVVKAVMEEIQRKWTTSPPDQVSSDAIKFLGMEIKEVEKEGRITWHLSQESYTRDLLQQTEEEVKPKKVPLTKDQNSALEEEDEEGKNPETVKRSQKEVGELLWLVTRTRVDLMFQVSRMGSSVLRNPTAAHEAYQQIKGYLQHTIGDGIEFDVSMDDPWLLESHTDSSFAPFGEESHGSFIISLCGCPMFWRSGRQPLTCLSTAESEMVEAIEGLVAGESVAVIAAELEDGLAKVAWTDNQAASIILTTDGGNWRTRHLKMRASAARQLIASGEWSMRFKGGEKMTADLGTKPLSSSRYEMLREEIKMRPGRNLLSADARLQSSGGGMHALGAVAPDADARPPYEGEGGMHAIREVKAGGDVSKQAKDLLKIVLVATLAQKVRSQEEGEEEDEVYDLSIFAFAFAMLIVLCTLGVERLWKDAVGPLPPHLRESVEDQDRSHPLEANAPTSEDEVTPMSQEETQPALSADARLQSSGGGMHALGAEAPVNGVDREPEEEESEDEIEFYFREIAEEEAELWRRYNEDNTIFDGEANDYQQDLTFNVLTTKYGSVYHISWDCGYLTSPQTGAARISQWCRVCQIISLKTRGRPPPGVELRMQHWGGTVHTDERCPMARQARRFSLCSQCRPLGSL